MTKAENGHSPRRKAEAYDAVNREMDAQHVGKLYDILPADLLPGLYRRQREIALFYLAPVADGVRAIQSGDLLRAERQALESSFTPSQKAAHTLLLAVDDLLKYGSSPTPHHVEFCAERQRAALLAHARLGASYTEQARSLRAKQREPREKAPPAWHAKVVAHARALLSTGTETHELAGKCAPKFGKSDDTVRKVLQDVGLVPKKAARSK